MYTLITETKSEDIPKDFTGIVKWSDGTKCYYINGKSHREDGPAMEYANGTKYYYLNGERFNDESEYNAALSKLKNKNSCENKIVEIEGKKYKLVFVE